MARRGRPRKLGRKKVRSEQGRKLVRQISSKVTRLKKRIQNVEKRGLGSYSTKEALKFINEKTSVKGLSNRKLQSLNRKLTNRLQTLSTSVAGAKKVHETVNVTSRQLGLDIDTSRYAEQYEEKTTKYKRYDKWLRQAFEDYPIISDKTYRYAVNELRTTLIDRGKYTSKKEVMELVDRIKEKLSSGYDYAFADEIEKLKRGKRLK